MRHLSSALARLAEGGRLVAITGRNTGPDQPAWRESFIRLQEKARVVFTATLAGQAYARYGTTIETRLTVIGLGFEEIGIHRRHGKLDGVWRDCVIVERLLEAGDGEHKG
jgi:hypothetical protein